ncbi:amino acid aminotransferase [Kordiimonas aestuarii]|uniref:amino acid aminotransferase n=1 Tax=Kordiimonas aestuarii TaxID=1005925 RepID=UPI0021D15BCA|nr:amino acid aminotransferase [Kordiimonas aestuarii]
MMFSHLTKLPADPILGLSALFKADSNPEKVDLGVGVYKTADGRTPILGAVQQAFARLSKEEGSKVYIAPSGWPGFTDACAKLVFGEDLVSDLGDRLGAIQTPGGCGALRLAFELIAFSKPDTTIWVSTPTWANHVPTLAAAGLSHKPYAYYDQKTATVDVDGMLASLEGAKPGDVVLLHACCHNPTGADLLLADWKRVAELLRARELVPFLDMAYQGFAAGLEEDAEAVRMIFASQPEALLSYSCSKNFGLYRERTGVLFAKGEQAAARDAFVTNLAQLARANYSMPPAHGAALATTVLEDSDLRADWIMELSSMRDRVNGLRRGLADAFAREGFGDRFSGVARQTGMFSLLSLSPEQVAMVQKDKSIYFPANGRINVAGLTDENIPYVARSIASVL